MSRRLKVSYTTSSASRDEDLAQRSQKDQLVFRFASRWTQNRWHQGEDTILALLISLHLIVHHLNHAHSISNAHSITHIAVQVNAGGRSFAGDDETF